MNSTLDNVYYGNRYMKEAWAIGLAFKCPCKTPIPCDCQLNQLRNQTPTVDLIRHIKNMSDADLNTLLCRHAECKHNN